jgi:hypothetical protein
MEEMEKANFTLTKGEMISDIDSVRIVYHFRQSNVNSLRGERRLRFYEGKATTKKTISSPVLFLSPLLSSPLLGDASPAGHMGKTSRSSNGSS